MELTPQEIKKQPFRKVTFNGLDSDHVYSFLQQVASTVADIRSERDDLAGKVKELSGALERYQRIEETLNETLLTAQRATDDARANAQKEAELIMKDAQVRSDRYENDSRDRVHQLDAEIRSLKAQKDSFLERFRLMMRDQLSFLDVMQNNLEEDSGHSERS